MINIILYKMQSIVGEMYKACIQSILNVTAFLLLAPPLQKKKTVILKEF